MNILTYLHMNMKKLVAIYKKRSLWVIMMIRPILCYSDQRSLIVTFWHDVVTIHHLNTNGDLAGPLGPLVQLVGHHPLLGRLLAGWKDDHSLPVFHSLKPDQVQGKYQFICCCLSWSFDNILEDKWGIQAQLSWRSA